MLPNRSRLKSGCIAPCLPRPAKNRLPATGFHGRQTRASHEFSIRAIPMSDDDKIYVDASQPATLVDGELNTDYPTLQGAAIAWHRMPPERQKTATIRDSTGREYTSQEIYRLNYAPKPDLAQSGRPTPASQPPFSFSYDSSDAASAVHAELFEIPALAIYDGPLWRMRWHKQGAELHATCPSLGAVVFLSGVPYTKSPSENVYG
jgi:hypothetical protein